MTPTPRTTHQRDRRFARVRLVTRSIFVGSSALSVGMVGYLASVSVHHKAATTPTTTTPTTAAPTTTVPSTGSTVATTPTTTTTVAPVTTTTVCTTSPSGNTTCY